MLISFQGEIFGFFLQRKRAGQGVTCDIHTLPRLLLIAPVLKDNDVHSSWFRKNPHKSGLSGS